MTLQQDQNKDLEVGEAEKHPLLGQGVRSMPRRMAGGFAVVICRGGEANWEHRSPDQSAACLLMREIGMCKRICGADSVPLAEPVPPCRRPR